MTQPPLSPRRHHVLVVDDDVEHALTLVRLLERASITARAVHSVNDALDALRAEPVDLVLTDLVMPGQSGLDLLRACTHLKLDLDVIMMTAFGTVERAVEAMRTGAEDFIVKPIKRAQLLKAVGRALERRDLRRENYELKLELARFKSHNALVGKSPEFLASIKVAEQAAASEATILLVGESGTGKELFAQHIHRTSPRSAKPFIPLHCAALPETIIESELFGHEAGAFTGASRTKQGQFEVADQGTLFLDEVGELPLSVQVKLLRVLQEGEFTRVGGTRPIRVDVRIIAATHRDLLAMVRDGAFREDLYYRLHVISVNVPPLRDRVDDVDLLVAAFLDRFANTAASGPHRISTSASEALRRYPWPGNVRELQNVIERACVLDVDGVVDVDDLPATVGHTVSETELRVPIGRATLADVERQLILATLKHTEGDKNLAASLLGLGRRTIYRKLDEYRDDGLTPNDESR